MTKLFFFIKKLLYARFSTNKRIQGTCVKHQPVVIRGKGEVIFGKNTSFGVVNAPFYYNTYAYIEARNAEAKVTFGDNTHINNSFSVISEANITIGSNVLIGFNCTISDSNFHDLNPNNRKHTDPNPEAVIIEDNVFFGNNVTILKGVTIGKNSVVASGAVVSKSFPENVVIGGVPAKILSTLDVEK